MRVSPFRDVNLKTFFFLQSVSLIPYLVSQLLRSSIMKDLYFDIDGTLLSIGTGGPKPALIDGRFEAAIRLAKIERLICVGNFCHVAEMIKQVDPSYDGLGIIFKLCQGVFADEEWFRSITTLIPDPEHRATAIDFSSDWWYVDDLAEQFFVKAGLHDLFRNQLEYRIFVPQPDGTGDDVLQWAARIAN
jgi:hypothetical protein